MKTIKEYLSESHKTYPWKVVVAGDIPEGFADDLKIHLEKFGVSKISKGKKTPIQERPLDFPNLNNTEVTFWDIELNYPTTDAVLKEYIGQVCKILASHIVVRNPNGPLEKLEDTKEETTYEALLTKEELDGECGQKLVGSLRVMDLIKELEAARKERDDSSGFKMETPKAEPQNNKSVVGK